MQPPHQNNTRDNDLKQIQTAVLNATAPLCGLWAQLLDQNLTEDSDLVQAPVVLDMIQRALVFLGNDTGKNLFGQSFMEELHLFL